MREAFRVYRVLLAASIALACLSDASATDLPGHWVKKTSPTGNGTQFDITQTGNVVTIPMSIFYSGFGSSSIDAQLAGTTMTKSGFVANGQYLFRANVTAGEDVLDGKFMFWSSTPPISDYRLLASRCECFDGDADDGDGCDANCQVEPCYECSGEPSLCTPLADGAACNDHQDCTGGETCSAGACGGGTAIPSCVDMTGRWKVSSPSDVNPAYLREDLRDVEQHDGFVRFIRPTHPHAFAEVGTLDQGTRTLTLSGGLLPGAVPYRYRSLNEAIVSCFMSSTGAVSADQQSFTATGTGAVGELSLVGTIQAQFYGGCTDDVKAFGLTGERCAPGDCLVVQEECPPCATRNASNVCVHGPRDDCLQSLDPRRSKVKLFATDTDEQRFDWRWKDGEAVTSSMLGDFSNGSGVQLCIFDGNSNVLFETYWTDTDSGWIGESDWLTKDGVRFDRSYNYYDGMKERVTIQPGVDGESGIRISAEQYYDIGLGVGIDPNYAQVGYNPYGDGGFPLSPFDLPVRIQAQVDRGGPCFQSTFDSTSVRKNEDGIFKAKATE